MGSNVSVEDIPNLNMKVIQGSHQKGNADSLTRDYAGICDGGRGFGHVPTSNKSGFASKVFHFDVKYHMAGYLLVTNWRRLPTKQDFEGNTNVLHFLGNGTSPEGITILLIELKVFDGLRQFNAKFIGLFQITGVLLSYK